MHKSAATDRKFTVTIEEHIAGAFTVYADSFSEAEEIARLKYDQSEFVVEAAIPTCRLMMLLDNETGLTSEWREF